MSILAIPIPHVPSHWRMASSLYRQPTTIPAPLILNQTTQPSIESTTTDALVDSNTDDIAERKVSNDSNETAVGEISNDDDGGDGSHRSFFGDFGSFFGSAGKGKHLLAKEEEYEDEYEEEKPPKKLLGKLGGKKGSKLMIEILTINQFKHIGFR